MTIVCLALITIAALATGLGLLDASSEEAMRAQAIALIALGASVVAFMNALWRNGGHEPPA